MMSMYKTLVYLLLVASAVHGSLRGNGNKFIKKISPRLLQQMNDKAHDGTDSNGSLVAGADLTSNPTSFIVDLLEITVWVEVISYSQSLSTLLDTHLTLQFGREFESLSSVDIIQWRVARDPTGLIGLVFCGIATFDGVVSIERVHEVQKRILQDTTSIQEIVPEVVSISILEPQFSPGGLIVVVILSSIGLVALLFIGYRRYKAKQSQRSGNVGDHQSAGKEIEGSSVGEFSTSTESETDQKTNRPYMRTDISELSVDLNTTVDYDTDQDIQSYGHQLTIGDDFSLNATTATDYDTDVDENAKRVHGVSQLPRVLGSRASDMLDESDADFTYSHIARKGMESDDDDLYTTENDSAADNLGGYRTPFSMLGREHHDDDYTETEEHTPTISYVQTLNAAGKTDDDCDSSNKNIHKHSAEDVDNNGDDDGDHPVIRKRSNKSSDLKDSLRTSAALESKRDRSNQPLAR